MNISELMRRGRAQKEATRSAEEAKKLGTLRAGNAGIMSEEGQVAGQCHRIAHLRMLGVDIQDHTESTRIMFQLGVANESIVVEDLVAGLPEGYRILRESEVPIKWSTNSGVTVSGRPDIVIVDSDKKPVLGLELKCVSSFWTSRDILGEKEPKLEHLIQAGHYSWKLGVPFRLVYKQYVIQEAPSWAMKFFPKPGEPGSEFLDYTKNRINPFELVYEIEFTGGADGVVRYRLEGATQWHRTLIRTADIERFYEAIASMGTTFNLGNRPLNISADGTEKQWSKCDARYCSMSEICDHNEDNYSNWKSAALALAREKGWLLVDTGGTP